MPINVAEAIDSDTAVVVTLEDKSGAYVDGIFEASAPVTRKALASVQQPTPQQLNFLEGGERTKQLRSFYLNKEVQSSSSENSEDATIIIKKGVRYKVVFAGDWEDYGWFFAIGAKTK